MMGNLRRALFIFACLSVLSCSHVTPYYGHENWRDGGVELNQIDHRLLLIGDAGAPSNAGEPVITALKRYVAQAPDKTTVVFLGDNIYEKGMPGVDDDSRVAAEQYLDAQIDVLGADGSRGIFIPGNHDWAKGGPNGWEHIKNLSQYLGTVSNRKGTRAHLYPDRGCPGPRQLLLGQKVSLIALDTQWWLHPHQKPDKDDPAGCVSSTEVEVLTALSNMLTQSAREQRFTVITVHHPLESYGSHAGFADVKAHLFPLTEWYQNLWLPLPVIGTTIVWVRRYFSPSRQDLSNETYEHMAKSIRQTLVNAAQQGAAPLVYAAGHDHSLQVIIGMGDAEYHLISGNGSKSKTTRVGHGDQTHFAHAHTGFMAVDFLVNGKVRLAVIEANVADLNPDEVYVTYLRH